MKKIIVGITGASGAILGQRLVRHILESGHEAHVVLSLSGAIVYGDELGVALGDESETIAAQFRMHMGKLTAKGGPKLISRLSVSSCGDMGAAISSGSTPIDGMVIAPCSMSTVAAIAAGLTMNLIHRAASVSIKEKRALVLVPRESPLSPIHLKNLLYLSELGVHILPATTAFYHRPKTVEEMVDFTLGRVLDIFKIEHKLFNRWKGLAS